MTKSIRISMSVSTKKARMMACALLTAIVLEMLVPISVLAITSGPVQPEFTGFEPLGTTGMVNEFSGAFTYNIPLLEVPGPSGSSYPVTMAYHSGAALEEDASWVGFGWSLNPGSINRNARGIPDDYNGAEVVSINRQEKNETFSVGMSANLQIASYDLFTFQAANRYNTFSGYSITSGFSLNVFNALSLNLESTNGIQRFSANINWANAFAGLLTSELSKKNNEAVDKLKSGKILEGALAAKQASDIKTARSVYSTVSSFVSAITGPVSTQTSTMAYTGGSLTIKFGATAGYIPGFILGGTNIGLHGNYTWQTPADNVVDSAYGYLYHGKALGVSSRMADRMFEREGVYTNRDRYLSPGYFSADDFAVTGQGIGGSMRLVHNRPGYAAPQAKSSKLINGTLGMELGAGPDKLTAGATVTIGENTTDVSGSAPTGSGWVNEFKHQAYTPDGNARAFMRFLNDPADNVRFSSSDKAAYTASSNQGPSGIFNRIDSAEPTDTFYRPRAAACISYRLNKELASDMTSGGGSPQLFSHAPNAQVDGFVNRSEPAIADGIGELSVANGNGIRYVYGLPVYNRNERQLSYTRTDVETMEKGALGFAYGARVLYPQRPELARANNVAGTIKAQPYASMFLLTAIQTPDYVDRTMDGPTADDFGGYTRFNYERAAGTYTKSGQYAPGKDWFKWRTPYRGYTWEEGNLTNKHDDRASVSMGEREMYYMSEIDTKTHTAIFITNKTIRTITVGGTPIDFRGSGKQRNDAFESINTGNIDYDEEAAGSELWRRHYLSGFDRDSAERFLGKKCGGRATNKEVISEDLIGDNEFANKSQCLERIVLLAKDENGNYTHIVKTVNLEYTYETMQSKSKWFLLNSRWNEAKKRNEEIENPNDWDSIYVISGGLNSRHYHTQQGVLPVHLGSRVAAAQYGKLTLKRIWTDYGDVQNATISPYEFIYSYRDVVKEPYAAELAQESRLTGTLAFSGTFINDTSDIADTNDRKTRNDTIENPAYDPVFVDAWGAYRRDGPIARSNRRSHLDQTYLPGKSTQYDPAAWQLKRIILPSGGEIEVQYEQNSYSFVQDRPVEAFVPITVYNEVEDYVRVGLDCSKLTASTADVMAALKKHVKLNRLFFKFLFPIRECSFDAGQEGFPASNSEYISGFVRAAVDSAIGSTIVVTLRGSPQPRALLKELVINQGLLDPVCHDSVKPKTLRDGVKGDISTNQATYERLGGMGGDISSWAYNISSWVTNPSCTPYLKHSYVRIPCISKVGGGIRVKRIYMYDAGIEEGRAGMYGREYIYERQEVLPGGARTISSGVATNEPAVMREESALYRFIVGRSEQSFEERLAAGEDLEQLSAPLCPSAWPGASIGYSRVVTRSIAFGETSPGYTVTDFFTARDYPLREEATRLVHDRSGLPPIPNPFLSVSITNIDAGQGFTVVTNQMHGKTRAIRQCAGSYSPSPTSWNVVASEEHEYFAPGEKIPVLTKSSEGEPLVVLREMGTSEEVMSSSRQIINNHISLSGNFDAGVLLIWAPVVHGATGSSMISEQRSSMYVSTKLVSYACFEKRVVYRRDGMVRVQENGAFDEGTGQPVVTIGYDEYDGADVGAGQVHAGALLQMTYPAWHVYPEMGSAMTNENLRDSITAVDASSMVVTADAASLFSPGDLVALVETMEEAGSHAPAFVRVRGVVGTTVNFYVLSGSPSTDHKVATIVRSGKTNQLTAAAGSIAMYGSRGIVGSNPFVPDSGRQVLSASATTWTDDLGIDTAEYYAIYGGRFSSAHNNPYQRTLKGKWRPHESFVFRSATESAVQDSSPRSAGRITSSLFESFPHANPSSRDEAKWVRTSRVLAYTPDGDVAIEHDAIGIPTTARFAHKGTLPSIIAKNADHAGVLFESFEDKASSSSAASHTGKRSLALTTTADSIGLINITERTQDDGLVARAWVRAGAADTCKLTIGTGSAISTHSVIADVAGWKLIEWTVPANTGALTSTGVKKVSVSAVGSGVYVDDLRVQPTSSSATCYVYDQATLRLVAQFDDQHFAALFKYTPDGRLTRKDRETEQGIFPLQEQHANSMSVKYDKRADYGLADYRPLMQRMHQGLLQEAANEIPVDLLTPKSLSPSGVGAKGELFDLKLSPERRRLKLFGDSVDLKKLDSIGRSQRSNGGGQ